MRALERHDLRGIRDNNGRWRIAADAVDDWASLRRTSDRQSPDMTNSQTLVTPSDTPETLTKLAVAEAAIKGLEARLVDTKSDRDAWRAQAERLASSHRETRPDVGIFGRLLRR